MILLLRHNRTTTTIAAAMVVIVMTVYGWMMFSKLYYIRHHNYHHNRILIHATTTTITTSTSSSSTRHHHHRPPLPLWRRRRSSSSSSSSSSIGIFRKQWWNQHLLQPVVSNAMAVAVPVLTTTTKTKPKTKKVMVVSQTAVMTPSNNDNHSKNCISPTATTTQDVVGTMSEKTEMNQATMESSLYFSQQQQQQQQIQTTKDRHHGKHNKHNNNNNPKHMAILVFVQRYMVLLIVALTRNTTVRAIQTIMKDWYTGYYLRTTLEHVEHQYNKRYDIPSCIRSMTRIVLHIIILLLLGRFMEEMVGLTHIPCSYYIGTTTTMNLLSHSKNASGGGCHWWCGLLWLIAVTGPGHAIGVAIAIWVPGLRLHFVEEMQPQPPQQQQRRPSLKHILARPGRIVRYIIDPDHWFREILTTRQRRKYHNHYESTSTGTISTTNTVFLDPVRQYTLQQQPFDPDYRMFPATWSTLRILQMIAIAKEMYGTNTIMHTFMHLVLIQQAFNDEWYRILMCEKRIVWGMIVMIGYTISTISLFWNMIHKPAHIVSSLSILMMTPSVLAVLISLWMNVLVYFERRQRLSSSSDPVQDAILTSKS